jgi:hypothetical protein
VPQVRKVFPEQGRKGRKVTQVRKDRKARLVRKVFPEQERKGRKVTQVRKDRRVSRESSLSPRSRLRLSQTHSTS